MDTVRHAPAAESAGSPAIAGLNAGQQQAADGFFQFLFDTPTELIISGPGGVGKTHLMSHLIDTILPQYQQTCKLMGLTPEFDSVVMTATTNKAAEVLAEATKRPTETIHSFLNLRVSDDFATGKSLLKRGPGWQVHHQKIIFVDEASMIDSALLAMIREGTCKCKVVYVGDHCQLAPIQEPLSPIYNQRLPFYELTEPMRTSDPHLQALNDQLRATVESGVFQPIRVVPGVIDHLDDAAMQAEIDAAFASPTAGARILAYTNKRVVAYADYVRGLRRYTDTYVKGERLISNGAVQLKNKTRLSVEEEVEVADLSPATETAVIEDGVTLTVRRATLKSAHGTYTEVPLPEDKAHFAALIDYYRKKKNWNRYFHLKNSFPDLRPRDAATLHKAQGSTYETVFIDLANLSTCTNPDQAARLLYVGCSRARRRVVLYGALAERYGGLLRP